jgi:hypothetical protein
MLSINLTSFLLAQFMTVKLAASIVVLILTGVMTIFLVLETD